MTSKKRQLVNDSPDEIAVLIQQAMATGMESLKETVAAMLKDSLKEALDPITKQMVENGNILRSLKEQSETHAKKFDTVFNKIDSMQVDLRKNEKETSSCFAGGDQAPEEAQ
ncbi:hypothetical protein AAFF_G00027450 [Aldrovandia affinis]|uniref:Uncharacterized protein n=1 Tax=Aldrovandia affinis TaxID=143900 RepID=A0AAD7WG87_9TELE|nr:hypothetical protein AAFF_G00027450 [Aldrovandia affinis]